MSLTQDAVLCLSDLSGRLCCCCSAQAPCCSAYTAVTGLTQVVYVTESKCQQDDITECWQTTSSSTAATIASTTTSRLHHRVASNKCKCDGLRRFPKLRVPNPAAGSLTERPTESIVERPWWSPAMILTVRSMHSSRSGPAQ